MLVIIEQQLCYGFYLHTNVLTPAPVRQEAVVPEDGHTHVVIVTPLPPHFSPRALGHINTAFHAP